MDKDLEVQKLLRLVGDAQAEQDFTNRVLAIINRFFAEATVQAAFNDVIDKRIEAATFNIELPEAEIARIANDVFEHRFGMGESNGSSQSG